MASDYAEKRVTQVQYAACMCLLLQLEMIITGVVSCISDQPTCKLLARTVRAAEHQQQELAYELGINFMVRRRLQEVYEQEEMQRRKRNTPRPPPSAQLSFSPESGSSLQALSSSPTSSSATREEPEKYSSSSSPHSNSAEVIRKATVLTSESDSDVKDIDGDKDQHLKKQHDKSRDSAGRDREKGSGGGRARPLDQSQSQPTCLMLWHQLGVGQATRRSSDRRRRRSKKGVEASSGNKDAVEKSSSIEKEKLKGAESSGSSSSDEDETDDDDFFAASPSHRSPQWNGFAVQLDFVDRLTELVDSLRYVDRPLRTETLCRDLAKLADGGGSASSPGNAAARIQGVGLGWDPTGCAGEPGYR